MNATYVFAFALGIGIVAGLRSMTAPAAVSWAAHLGWLNLQGSAFGVYGIDCWGCNILAVGDCRICRGCTPQNSKMNHARTLDRPRRYGRPHRRMPLRIGQPSLASGTVFGRNRRCDRSVLGIRSPKTSGEKTQGKRCIHRHMRRPGRDRLRILSGFATIAHSF